MKSQTEPGNLRRCPKISLGQACQFLAVLDILRVSAPLCAQSVLPDGHPWPPPQGAEDGKAMARRKGPAAALEEVSRHYRELCQALARPATSPRPASPSATRTANASAAAVEETRRNCAALIGSGPPRSRDKPWPSASC